MSSLHAISFSGGLVAATLGIAAAAQSPPAGPVPSAPPGYPAPPPTYPTAPAAATSPAAPGYPTAAPPPTTSGPSAGGLTAPGPVDPSRQPAPGQTEQQLDASREEDSGRGLTWFWIEGEGGFQHVNLETFEVDKTNLTAGFVPNDAAGGFVGAGLGVQLLYFRLGPRGRVGFYKDWQLFSIGGELGLRLPFGMFEPHLELGAGYTALGNLSDTLRAVSAATKIAGFDARISGGLDIFIGKVFSIGALASWEFMGLTRPGVSRADLDPASALTLTEAEQKALAAEGSSYGAAVSIGGKVGLSF